MKLQGVMLGTEDPKKLADFYSKFLGDPVWNKDDWYSFFPNGSLTIGKHSEVNGKSKEPPRVMIMIESNDVKVDFATIKATGAEVIAEPYQPSPEHDMWLATFADIDGNYFQIGSQWKE